MSRQIAAPTQIGRNHAPPSCGGRFAEVAGGTTAECAAVCCCCPCSLINILVMTFYKLPAVICRRALKKNRRRRQAASRGLLIQRRRCGCGCDETDVCMRGVGGAAETAETAAAVAAKEAEKENTARKIMELEEEMWDRFYSTGFWRSCSQREEAEKRSCVVVDSVKDDSTSVN